MRGIITTAAVLAALAMAIAGCGGSTQSSPSSHQSTTKRTHAASSDEQQIRDLYDHVVVTIFGSEPWKAAHDIAFPDVNRAEAVIKEQVASSGSKWVTGMKFFTDIFIKAGYEPAHIDRAFIVDFSAGGNARLRLTREATRAFMEQGQALAGLSGKPVTEREVDQAMENAKTDASSSIVVTKTSDGWKLVPTEAAIQQVAAAP